MTTKLSEDEIWKRRREQANPPTPGNPAFSVDELRKEMWHVSESPEPSP